MQKSYHQALNTSTYLIFGDLKMNISNTSVTADDKSSPFYFANGRILFLCRYLELDRPPYARRDIFTLHAIDNLGRILI